MTSSNSSGVTVSLGYGSASVGELLRHFPASKGDAAWREYERRLRAVADILNPHPAAAALQEAEAALDIAQAAIDHPRDRARMLSALKAVREATSSI
jgi:hypothetical protein